MGRCRVCDRLVPIEAKELRGVRQHNWYPKSHPEQGDDTGGRDCPGVRKAI